QQEPRLAFHAQWDDGGQRARPPRQHARVAGEQPRRRHGAHRAGRPAVRVGRRRRGGPAAVQPLRPGRPQRQDSPDQPRRHAGGDGFADWRCGRLFVQRPGQSGSTFDTLSMNTGKITWIGFLPDGTSLAMYYTVRSELHRVTGPGSPPPPPMTNLKYVAVSPT